MTTVRNKSRYDKEMSAVTYNMKEQRVLEKSMQTLKLEQSYAMKLLELDNRIIKVHYKKLKEKVSKIKSHLPPEDISKFRDLDQRGKLKSTQNTMSLSSAVKIAAASRRLNLNSEGSGRRRNIKSALPRIAVASEDEETIIKSSDPMSKPPVVGKLHRSNSVTGAFIDAPPQEVIQRPGSAFPLQQHREFSNHVQSDEQTNSRLQETGVNHLTVNFADTNHRPTSSVNFKSESRDEERHSPNGTLPNGTLPNGTLPNGTLPNGTLPNGTLPRRSSTAPHSSHSHSRFSSHMALEKEGKVTGTAASTPRIDQSRRLSHISLDSIDSNLGENLFEERRQELLEEESVRAATLDKKTKMFLKEVEEYLEKNPPLQASHVAFEHPLPEPPRRDSLVHQPASKDPFGDNPPIRQRMGRRSNDRPVDGVFIPTFFPEDTYKQKLLNLWKDMNKCRYLRLPEENIDLSGVNTLVKDQMKLYDALRNQEAMTPFTTDNASK